MNLKTKIAAIIPARMASERFPGKPLLEIAGLPMIEHVRRRALLCREFSEVIVATCDKEIAFVVERFGGRVAMTSDKHQIATERIVEAVLGIDCTHVVNVQGDEILLIPQDLERMLRAMFERPESPVWNAIAPLESKEALQDRAMVKCLVTKSDKILFCSRSFSAYPAWLVVGILGYRRDFLEKIPKMPQTPLESLESIEQSRFLENDISIQGIRFEKAYPGINTPEEAETVKKILGTDPVQKAIMRNICNPSRI